MFAVLLYIIVLHYVGYDGEENDILSADSEYEFIDKNETNNSNNGTNDLTTSTNTQQSITTPETTINEFNELIQSIDQHFATYEWLSKYSKKYNIKGIYIISSLSILLLCTTAIYAGFIALIHSVIWLYASYSTYQCLANIALNNNNNNANKYEYNTQQTQPILVFWSVYMLYRLVEQITDAVVYTLCYSSILYTTTKLCLLAWLMLPQTHGYTIVYNKFISQLYDQYEDTLQLQFYNIYQIAGSIVIEMQTVLFKSVGTYLKHNNNSNYNSISSDNR